MNTDVQKTCAFVGMICAQTVVVATSAIFLTVTSTDHGATCYGSRAENYNAFQSRNLFVTTMFVAQIVSRLWSVVEGLKVQQLAQPSEQGRWQRWAPTERLIWLYMSLVACVLVDIAALVWIYSRDAVCLAHDVGLDKARTLRGICLHSISDEKIAIVSQYTAMAVNAGLFCSAVFFQTTLS